MKEHVRHPASRKRGTIGTILSSLLAPMAKRFIAGTSLKEGLAVAKKLTDQGFLTTLDHLGEKVQNPDEASQAAEQYIELLTALASAGLHRQISLKLTQLGLDLDREQCAKHLERIVETAETMQGFVRVDMEGSEETTATLELVRQAHRSPNSPLGAVLQAMLKRTPDDLSTIVSHGISLRLCKGAYKEPATIALSDHQSIRDAYLLLAKQLLTSGQYHAIATHDRWLLERITAFAREQGIAKDQFEFQMLLGIRRKLQREMLSDGWRVRIYIPFGRAWLPYTLRRLRERKENVWFVIKHLFLG